MPSALPRSTRQLHWLLARKLAAAALAIGFAAAAVSWVIETRRAERATLERVTEGVGHFASPAMRMAIDAGAAEGHDALKRLLDRSHFIGVRVFDARGRSIYDAWDEVPAALVTAARAQAHDWPQAGEVRRHWIDAGNDRLVRVVLPLVGDHGVLLGYLEGVGRLDAQALRTQAAQIRNGALTAAAAVAITALLLYPLLLAMLRRSNALSRRLLDANLSLLRSLGNAVAKRDSDTDAHNYRVTLYAVALAEAMKLPPREIADLVVGAFLHDVGKIGIPDRILLKPGKLDAAEYEIMKRHVLLGIEILADNPWLAGAAQTIRYHHERFDGAGYPDGLRGTAIPLAARIFAVVDVFDALSSKRPYKEAISLAEGLPVIAQGAGSQFDPLVVAGFMGTIPALHRRIVQADAGQLRRELGAVLERYFDSGAMPQGDD